MQHYRKLHEQLETEPPDDEAPHAEELATLFDYGISVEQRRIYILSQKTDPDGNESGIDVALVAYVTRALDFLEGLSRDEEISFVLSSPGGGWDEALAIYDRIMLCPCPTVMTVFGAAYSGAPIILQAADRRLITPRATLLIHDGSIMAPGGEENTRDVEAWGRFSSRVERPRMYDILSRRSKYTSRQWKEFCKQDFYLTAKKAIDFRLVDAILDPRNEVNTDRPRFETLSPKRK